MVGHPIELRDASQKMDLLELVDHCSLFPESFRGTGVSALLVKGFSAAHLTEDLFARYEVRSSKSRFSANRFLFTKAEQENEGNPKMMPPLEKQQLPEVLFKFEVFRPSRMAGCCFVLPAGLDMGHFFRGPPENGLFPLAVPFQPDQEIGRPHKRRRPDRPVYVSGSGLKFWWLQQTKCPTSDRK